jgi:hypothetical protein
MLNTNMLINKISVRFYLFHNTLSISEGMLNISDPEFGF